ncbi:uncharacterized protein TNCV_3248761 [Trichonephila clavipes]|nr:uncharacterized protein TNCV_3248761 [Trichonephila clavipes]
MGFFKATDDIDCGSDELLVGALQMNEVNSGLYADNDIVIQRNSIRKISALAKDHQNLEKVIVTGMKYFEWSKYLKVSATIDTLQNGKIDIRIAISSSQPQIIPAGMHLAEMRDIEDGVVSSLNGNVNKIKVKQWRHLRQSVEEFKGILDPKLHEAQQKDLLKLLNDFTDVFDFENKISLEQSKTQDKHWRFPTN